MIWSISKRPLFR